MGEGGGSEESYLDHSTVCGRVCVPRDMSVRVGKANQTTKCWMPSEVLKTHAATLQFLVFPIIIVQCFLLSDLSIETSHVDLRA